MNLGFVDLETASQVPIEDGTWRYLSVAKPLILAYAIGDAPARALPKPLRWADLPAEIHQHQARVEAGEAYWCAWNAIFDREVWNQITDFPWLEPEHMIDAMAQAMVAGLPGKLDGAARFSGCDRKVSNSKDLIEYFQDHEPEDDPIQWQQFLDYAANDVEIMRAIYRRTLQLPLTEWQEYWAAEHVNITGIGVDLVLARAAENIVAIDRKAAAVELNDLTNGKVTAVTQVKRMIAWLHDVLDPEGQALMVRELEVLDDNGETVKEGKRSLNRARINHLIAYLQNKEQRSNVESIALRMLELRQFGGSTTPAKFTRIRECEVEGKLRGQFVFNGAPQTGRFSSRVTQLHNLMRDAMDNELDLIDALRANRSYQDFKTLCNGIPVSRALSMLIRPTLVPAADNVFVWGDWNQIEARKLPWLAGSQERLDIFRAVDADPSTPDIYTRTAAKLSGIDISLVDKPLRQRGKVVELACGYGGGRGALQNMAVNYGMYLSDTQASDFVFNWRADNAWAVNFWNDLWTAAQQAIEAPDIFVPVGRCGYIFLKDYLGGSLLCQLPSGRMLTYRGARWERIDEVNDEGVVTGSSWTLTFARGYGRIKMWHGLLTENVTQAASACILRGTIARLPRGLVRAHTHDEILVEVTTRASQTTSDWLVHEMERGFDWSDGLPLKAEASMGYAYSKCLSAQGL